MSDPVKLPLDLLDRLVGPASSEGPNHDPQAVVEPAGPGLIKRVGLEVGLGRAGEPGLCVHECTELPVDKDVVLSR